MRSVFIVSDSIDKLWVSKHYVSPPARSCYVRAVPSWLCLDAVTKNPHETYQCRTYSRKLLMMGREDARNM